MNGYTYMTPVKGDHYLIQDPPWKRCTNIQYYVEGVQVKWIKLC